MLLCILIPVIYPQVSHSRGVGVIYDFVKISMVPGGYSGINSCANIFGTSNELDVFQDNCLKNDHPLRFPFLSSYAIELRCEG